VSTTHQQHSEEKDPVAAALKWIKAHRNQLVFGAAIAVITAASAWWMVTAVRRKEAFAAGELANARAVAAAGNLALAASDLSQFVETYGETQAGEEGAILLAQIRLMEGQPDAAVQALQGLVDRGPSSQFEAPAHGLLGNSLEESGDYAAAASSYEAASRAAWYDFLKAQYLVDAARVYQLAGDTGAAMNAYERVLSDFPDSGQYEIEARIRLAELRRGDPRATS
jgi:tetratricopeptide (TPR) repeat protein